MTLGFALVTAFLYLSWLTDVRSLLWVAFALGLVFASGLSLSGHSAADAGHSWLSELADWVHLTAAMLWVGGLVQLLVVVWPARRSCARRPSSASPGSPRCSSRACSPRAPTSACSGSRTCTISGRRGYGHVLL